MPSSIALREWCMMSMETKYIKLPLSSSSKWDESVSQSQAIGKEPVLNLHITNLDQKLILHTIIAFYLQMTLIGDFNWDGLVSVHRVMAQVLVGTYFALAGVVCMNLYIALLSDTFSRVYARALANAVMQQAHIILSIEKSLSKKRKIQFGHYMKNECGPLVCCNSCIM